MELKRAYHTIVYYVWFGELTDEEEKKELLEGLSDLRKLVATYNGTFDLFDMSCGVKTISKITLSFENFEDLVDFVKEADDHDVLFRKYSITDREAIRWSHGR